VYYLTVGAGVLTLAALPYTSSIAAEGGLALGTTSLGNEFLFVANESALPPSISVFFVNPGGTLGLPVQYFDATLNLPTGVAVDPTGGFLYVANQGNGTISRFTIDPTTGALGAGIAFATESPGSAPLFLALGQ
jgi:6-phosphogluconolactonase (cycloisomerase 2 family)